MLCRTSNPGAGDLQDLIVDGTPLYQHVAANGRPRVEHQRQLPAGGRRHLAGATGARCARLVGDMPFLVPGVGAQGGDVEEMVAMRQTAYGDRPDDQFLARDPLRRRAARISPMPHARRR